MSLGATVGYGLEVWCALQCPVQWYREEANPFGRGLRQKLAGWLRR